MGKLERIVPLHLTTDSRDRDDSRIVRGGRGECRNSPSASDRAFMDNGLRALGGMLGRPKGKGKDGQGPVCRMAGQERRIGARV